MSLINITQLLNQMELSDIDLLLGNSEFVDGSKTASLSAKAVKNNMQIDVADTKTLPQLQNVLNHALSSSPLFQIFALPKLIYPFIISKYTTGMAYGWHVDSPKMGNPAIRTDLAMTIFLSDPASYEGGELLIQSGQGATAYKPKKGDAIVYGCNYLHCVSPIISGERLAAVTWIQSEVASGEKRQILFDLNQVHGAIYQKDPNAAEGNLLLQTHSNLLRMWLG